LIHTDTPFPIKSTTGKKWGRFRDGLQWIIDKSKESDVIDTAKLRCIVGLGVNVTDLKGFFNAIEAWRFGRDLDGWRLSEAMMEAYLLEATDAPRVVAQQNYPAHMRITTELIDHIGALQQLFESKTPLMIPVRPTDKHKLRYVVGDALLKVLQ